MSASVYPIAGSTPNAHASAFFSAIPRAVWDLCHSKALNGRDVQVLGVLLDHKNRRTTEVDPKQETIALRLGCSIPTVERSVARLVKAGLITKRRIRNALGRLGRCVYDLAGTLALMPTQASKLKGGQFGQPAPPKVPAADGNTPPAPSSTTHQKCGVSEVDSDSVVEADRGADSPPTNPVAVAMIQQGVIPKVAAALVGKLGEERCQKALTALQGRRNVRSRPAWLVGCLLGGWQITPRPAGPQSHQPYTPPRAAGTPPDPLATLPVDAYAALESQARAALLGETTGPVLALLRQGRNQRLVQGRMRQLLTASIPAQAQG